MKFTNRNQKITIDGQCDIVISRNSTPLYVDRDDNSIPVRITNFRFWGVPAGNRLYRFLWFITRSWDWSR